MVINNKDNDCNNNINDGAVNDWINFDENVDLKMFIMNSIIMKIMITLVKMNIKITIITILKFIKTIMVIIKLISKW